jgi:hypothetical protein
MQQTLIDQYMLVTSSNTQHLNNRDQWQFLLESYMGGLEYQRGQHLTKYVNETGAEYAARLNATHLENHSKSVISTYISFLFREHPHREFGSIEYDAMLDSFLEDADLDGRSLDAFMKEVATWSSVFGHVWIMCVKPNVGALTKGDELAADVRPYLTMITPLVVTDWKWNRLPNGRYNLTYLKYVEDVNDTVGTIKEWFGDQIHTWVVDHNKKEVMEHIVEPNPLGEIPAVCAYNVKSPVRGIGQSDITDIARAQKTIYNLTSEMEQSIRINGHPALVKTPGTEATAGAGAIIQMEDNLDPGLKPYMLSVSTDITSIFTAITHITGVIDQIANTGSIRSTESKRMSGIAQQQEFELLNAKLSEKADNLQLVEEQIWQWYSHYQGYSWNGKVEYPGSFNIKDTSMELDQLLKAKSAATDPRIYDLIDHEIVELLGEDPNMLKEEVNPALVPAQPPFDIHVMINPDTGEEFYARTEQEHLDYAALGYVHKRDE